MPAQYVIGIDLGTTNTAVAYVDLNGAKVKGRRVIEAFEVPQLVAPGEVQGREGLPSFLYLPGGYDLPEGSTALPWDLEGAHAVGELAREQGAKVPGRLVASAKSWLSHDGVDRTADLLPWGASKEVDQVSPVEASRRYLQHLREAWDHTMPASFRDQIVILTVPASFDEVARELTVTAARRAGLDKVILLEEPLAAFYAWMSGDTRAQRAKMAAGDLVLVCDIGGGTTDFSLVALADAEDGGFRFDRLAVGDHLMLGGDNMDNALGRHVEIDLVGGPGKLDAQRWHQLVHRCRLAKERLLSTDDAEASEVVTVMGSGSSLIGGALSSTLNASDVERLLLDGFFPASSFADDPQRQSRAGLTEFGLPYESDPAITRHLSAFLRRYAPLVREHTGRDAVPTHILFNGGVMASPILRERIRRTVGQWYAEQQGDGWQPTELANARLDLAVAQGAAYYGLVRLGEGQRVGSGSPRAYYVGVEAGSSDEQVAVCLVPRGAEEGFSGHLDERFFQALTNQPVTFQLFTSTTRPLDDMGDIVRLDPSQIDTLPPIRTVLQFGRKAVARALPIELGVDLTEIGTLALWCQSRETKHRWELEFDVRHARSVDATSEDAPGEVQVELGALDEAEAAIRATFANEPGSVAPEVLREHLEALLDLPRTDWSIPVLRRLADVLLDVPRDASPKHETHWFNLLGFCLRPGFGDPADAFRLKQTWKIYLQGFRYPDFQQARLAWWLLWRRVGAGLPANKQEQIYYDVRSFLQQKRTKKTSRLYPSVFSTQERLSAWMTLASFEGLSRDIRTTLGQLFLLQFKKRKAKPKSAEWWALCRVGARQPIYGPLDCVVPPAEIEQWLKVILTAYPPRREAVGYALTFLAQQTGDRARDLSEEARHSIYRWLRKLPDEQTDYFRELLADPERTLTREERSWFFGEPLPKPAKALDEPLGLTFAATYDGLSYE